MAGTASIYSALFTKPQVAVTIPNNVATKVSFEKIRAAFVGGWVGIATTPWTDPYHVTITFMHDGHYSAVSKNPSIPAFYYGTDEDSEHKTYSIENLNSNGEAIGEIKIYFGPNSVTTGELRKITLSSDYNRLSFEFWHFGQYGPIKYELRRVE